MKLLAALYTPFTPFARPLVCLVLAVGLGSTAGAVHAQPAEVRSEIAATVLSGSMHFTVLGFDVYDAALWVAPGFKAENYAQHAFALELRYLRNFSNEDITARSIKEMQAQGGASTAQRNAWAPLLRQAFPDVRKGDRITGIHNPATGTVFVTNGRVTGRIADPDFGRQFFGIWLSPATSEPRMRAALLAHDAAR